MSFIYYSIFCKVALKKISKRENYQSIRESLGFKGETSSFTLSELHIGKIF